MRKRSRGMAAGAGLAVLALLAAACGGSSSTGGTSSSSGSSALGLQGLQMPGSGTPKSGGTLNMLGQGDVDFFDYNISYYSIGYLAQRAWIRGLYAYPATPGQTTAPAPDLATAAPVVSDGGLKYTITIRTRAMWNSSPARQVTAADAVLGLKRSCNPVQPFGGLPDFESLIVGYQTFCTDFAKAAPTVAGIKAYIDSHQISGVTASGQTLTYTLTHPATYFPDMLTLDAFNPAPVESLNYLPASAAAAQHTIRRRALPGDELYPDPADRLYPQPGVEGELGPDPQGLRRQDRDLGDRQPGECAAAAADQHRAAGMEFDAFPPVGAVPGLVHQMQQGLTQNINLGPQYSSNPFSSFNEVSPNNGGALAKVEVRQALSYGIDRDHLVSDAGGPVVSPPVTHVLPTGINGSRTCRPAINPYPYNPSKAKSMLARRLQERADADPAVPPGQHDLGQDGADPAVRPEQDRRHGQAASATSADFYVKYLEVPTVAKRGVWDMALAGWGTGLVRRRGDSFFGPLFDGAVATRQSAATSGSTTTPR